MTTATAASITRIVDGTRIAIQRGRQGADSPMVKRIPTQAGDVLVLWRAQSDTIYVAGRISNDGQQDFQHLSDLKCEKSRGAALATAKSLRSPGGRIFLADVDTNTWSEISDAN